MPKHPGSVLATKFDVRKLVLLDTAKNVYKKMKHTSKPLCKAARSMLVSASFSILMRTENSDKFADCRKRAMAHIRKYRLGTFFDLKIRLRNRMAILLSYLPRPLFLKLLKKGLS